MGEAVGDDCNDNGSNYHVVSGARRQAQLGQVGNAGRDLLVAAEIDVVVRV